MTAADDQFDAEADATIIACLDLCKPRSFFLYAGAGSGKTRSLVSAVRKTIDGEHGRQLTLTGKKMEVPVKKILLGQPVETVQGGVFKIESSNGLKITDGRNRMANITATDVAASNGVIHAIDTVLMPK